MLKTLALTCAAMLAFAANSLLCRIALDGTTIDPVAFTLRRLVSGAALLGWLASRRAASTPQMPAQPRVARWSAAAMLFIYAAGFSLAYESLSAASGALILFGCVQLTMITWGCLRGERIARRQWLGLLVAGAGLLYLLAPGLDAPDPGGALLMAGAGMAWAAYTLHQRGHGDPLATTAANFARCIPFALVWAAASIDALRWDAPGLLYAVLSGALASGLGYAIWYSALPRLSTVTAASVQLSVPPLTAILGMVFLHEALHSRLLLAGFAILGGIVMCLPRAARRAASMQ